MYKIMIKIATRDGYQWSFYQEDGEDYSGSTIAEIREKALELLDEYGEDNVKIVDEMCGDDLDNVISYVFGSEGGTTDYNPATKKYVDDYLSTLSGYDATATQVLKNVNGTWTWITE